MSHKKLAVLLLSAVMLGQTSFLPAHLAQASSQVPSKITTSTLSPRTENLQVASVLEHSDLDQASDTLMKHIQLPQTPDIYTIGAEQGKLRTLIQVIPQDEDYTSLFVNGSEILRFHGTVAEKSSYQRVKSIAAILNENLSEDLNRSARITLDADSKNTITIGDSPLAQVDSTTAASAHSTSQELAFIYTNRLRQALGQAPLRAPQLAPALDKNQETAAYKPTGRSQRGLASWYGGQFHGRRTASGLRFNQFALTAAHRTLPFGTLVRVTNQRNHKSCMVKITDRGPYAHGRIIDLSKGAAQAIGMPGVAKVSLEVLSSASN